MIHVKPRPEEIPADWIRRARTVTEQLDACEDDGEDVEESKRLTAHEKRAKIVERNSTLWSELKIILLSWSHNKCWYSELRDDGSDYHVDHFRPKLRVRNFGEPERDGYWWLAFEWTNYRIAVSWVNSAHKGVDGAAKGKQDQFPLLPGCTVAVCGGDISQEVPVLLDPMCEDDTLLLDFDETGLPRATAGGWNAERVRISTHILHLDCQRMVEARQDMWRRCVRLLGNAAEALNVPSSEYRPRDGKTAKDWIEEICDLLKPDSPLSSVAVACVSKSEHAWARRLPQRVAAAQMASA
ncbi:hypothetical protein [Geodermatophilus sp. URMC 60]